MHSGWTWSESLELCDSWLFEFVVCLEDFGDWTAFCGLLTVYEVYGEAFWVVDGDHVAASGRIFEFLDWACAGEFGCSRDL